MGEENRFWLAIINVSQGRKFKPFKINFEAPKDINQEKNIVDTSTYKLIDTLFINRPLLVIT